MSEASKFHDSAAGGTPVFSGDEFYSLFRQARMFIFIACAVVGAGVFYLERAEILSSPTFTSATEVSILPGESQIDYTRRALAGARDGQISAISRTVSETLKSDDVIEEAVSRVSQTTDAEVLAKMTPSVGGGSPVDRLLTWINYGILPEASDDPLARYRSAVDVVIIDGAFILRVSASTPDPELSADLANALVEVYNENDTAAFDEAKIDQLAGVSAQLESARAELLNLSKEEFELEAQAEGASGEEATRLAAERRMNIGLQDSVANVIAELTVEAANIERASGGLAPEAKVLRRALVDTVPDGPTPLAKGLAYAAGLFVFFIGYLIFVSLMRTILRTDMQQ